MSDHKNPTPEERTTTAIDMIRGDLQRFEDAAENVIIEAIREAADIAYKQGHRDACSALENALPDTQQIRDLVEDVREGPS